jgi:hypothetical protein
VISLARLLQTDALCPEEQALPDAVGDRFLYRNNALFSRIRTLFLSHGFRYSCEASRLWRDYDSMSLLMLQDMIDCGVVPYKDNAVTLRRITQANPELELPIGLLLNTLQRNFLLHESAHCISYKILKPRFCAAGPVTEKERYVLVSITCEAYGNTVERLASALAQSNVHRLFWNLNSYAECRADTCTLVRESMGILGIARTFTAALLAFFYLNTHEEDLPEAAMNLIVRTTLGGNDQNDPKCALMRALVHGLRLNRKFRTDTTPLYFRYFACEREYQQLSSEHFSIEHLSSVGILEAISALSEVTCDGLADQPLRERPPSAEGAATAGIRKPTPLL